MENRPLSAAAPDDRWGGFVPWPFRVSSFSSRGDFPKFFDLLAQRAHQLFLYNEAVLPNLSYFGAQLTSATFGVFTFDSSRQTLADRARDFFSWASIERAAGERLYEDPEHKEWLRLKEEEQRSSVTSLGGGRGISIPLPESRLKKRLTRGEITAQLTEAQAREYGSRPHRKERHRWAVILERLGVLEALLRLLPRQQPLLTLIADVRKFLVATGIPLDVKGDPPSIVPLEEGLLQDQVINPLLGRLETVDKTIAADLVKSYHDCLQGTDPNVVFGNAYKALEKLARRLAGQASLLLSDAKAVKKHFPDLHGTIYATIDKLAAHSGDEGRHGGKGPDAYELRYLLFSVCNVALLLLDVADSRAAGSMAGRRASPRG